MNNLKLVDGEAELDLAYEGVTPEQELLPVLLPSHLRDCSLDELWTLRELTDRELRDQRDRKTSIDMELTLRFAAAHPDFTEETGGGRELAGTAVVVGLTYSRDYEYSEDVLREMQARKLLTPEEFDKLVPRYEPKVNGTAFNQLQKRGGDVAECLGRLRVLKHARPDFKAKERA